ncbi:MAG: hypothetical protein ACK4P3_05340 [Fimbriimonadaceae bacterium]
MSLLAFALGLPILATVNLAQPEARAEMPFVAPLQVAQLNRIAATPRLDGVIEEEEWEPLASGFPIDTWFQWQPSRLHAAARLPIDQDLIISYDLLGNGWLVGADNLEIRIRWGGGEPSAVVRRLDASDRSGPVWVPEPNFQKSLVFAAVQDGEYWVVESTLVDPGLNLLPSEPNRPIGVRMDAVDPLDTQFEPFLNRLVAPLTTALSTTATAPPGFRFNPQYRSGPSVMPGNNLSLRFNFEGNNQMNLRRIDLRAEGFLQQDALEIGIPFPRFDNRGRALVDYNSPISSDAAFGYRVIRARIADDSGVETVCRASIQIAPPVSIQMTQSDKISSRPTIQNIRIPYRILSNTSNRVQGTIVITPPEGFVVLSGNDQNFNIANPRGSMRRVFEVQVPADASGSFPFVYNIVVGATSYTQTVWFYLPEAP